MHQPDEGQAYLQVDPGLTATGQPFSEAWVHHWQPDRELWNSFESDRHPDLIKAVKTIREWYNERIEVGGALVLAGGYGCGKTHLARAILRMYGPFAHFLYEPEFIASIQDTYSGNGSEARIYRMIASHKLLIIDDLGAYEVSEKSERWLQNIYQRLLNNRFEQGKATLITTNLDDGTGDLRYRLGEKCYDRLLGALEHTRFYVNLFDVPSYRARNFG
jgi:DNA replication protein DnaC